MTFVLIGMSQDFLSLFSINKKILLASRDMLKKISHSFELP